MEAQGMRRVIAGTPIYPQRSTAGVQRPRTWTPKYSGRYGWAVGKWVVWVTWERFLGYYPTGAWLEGSGWPGTRREFPDLSRRTVKKPNAPLPPVMPDVLPAYETAVLKKFKRLTAFLTDRWYDDGSPRMPGSMWFDSDATGFTVMLKEKMLLLCVRLRAATLDDAFAAAEAFLGLESPPWEVDQYAADRAGKKSKK